MAKVLFFAQLREVLGTDKVEVQQKVSNVGELRAFLQDTSPTWKENLSPDKSLVAVNQTIGDDKTPVNDEDEIAFFPPVTGG